MEKKEGKNDLIFGAKLEILEIIFKNREELAEKQQCSLRNGEHPVSKQRREEEKGGGSLS